MKMKSNYTSKIWVITDLIKCIGAFKHQFEHCLDREKLNNTNYFQNLIFHLFHNQYDSGIILRQKKNNDRLCISICKHKSPMVLISFEIFEKYKRTPKYFDTLFLDFNENPLHNQMKISNHILNDNMLLEFFYERQQLENK